MSKQTGHFGTRFTRRRLLQTASVAVPALGLAVLGHQRAEAQEKVAKDSVNYRSSPENGQRCADCRFFQEGGTCERVKGEISPDGWCTLWSPKP